MKLTVIGGGNMGGAIVRGLVRSSLIKADDITVIDRSPVPLEVLQKFNPKINVASNNYESVEKADVIILAVKPWSITDVLIDIKFLLDYSKQMIVSVAAGISIDEMNGALTKIHSEKQLPAVFRAVPNTAIAVKQSITLVAASSNATDEQQKAILNIFDKLGSSMLTDESKLPAGTALTSCGIAFFFRYVRAAVSAGVEMGFYPEEAQEMIVKTMLGAAKLLDETKNSPEAEIDKVTTPGGITIKGMNELDANGFSNAIIKAFKACR
ncbi:MAG: pyrroline-5-carboxylate reductase [Dysgonamonadaceae bacterium]|jgi:pyrroline-5-carboxylate reductase|nr:pyrroline-5-carboxylate reductase [Dysgonamonadaceae bacterium]